MSKENNHLKEVAQVIFKLGVIGFGGPAVHISMLEEEVVEKRKWVTRQHSLDLLGATNLIPGPNSTQMTMHLGKERAGNLGLFVGGISFFDFNNDGWDDLSFSSQDGFPLYFYQNNNGFLTPVTLNLVYNLNDTRQLNWVDIDNDVDND